ncbi:MAG: phage tail tube protein [Candidatus Paceibacterota bacterium]
MSFSTNIHALSEWLMALVAETTIGTANVTSMQKVNIDSLFSVSDNPLVVHDQRFGDGRTLKKADTFHTEKGQIKSISFSGLLDETVARILLPNCMGVAGTGVGTEKTYEIPYNYTGTNIFTGDILAEKSIGTLTIALISPETNKTRIYPGCIIDELTITADQATDGGRFHFSATALTRFNPTNSANNPASPLAYGTTIPTICEFTTKTIDTKVIIINKIELSLKSNVKFFGTGADCIPELMGRGIPRFEANMTIGTKYDANTLDLYQKFSNGGDVAFNFADADSKFVISASYGKVTADINPADNEGAAFIDIPLMLTAHTSGNIIKITI